MTKLTIQPRGDFNVSIGTDDAGQAFVGLHLPDDISGDSVALLFDPAALISFADWVTMIADNLLAQGQVIQQPE